MNKKKIFITGATGFIGKHLLMDLDYIHYDCIILSRNHNTSEFIHNVKVINKDILKINECSKYLSTCDYIINICGEKNNEKEMYKVNVEGTIALLEELIKYPNLQLIHISTSGIYNIFGQKNLEISEDTVCHPKSTYEKTKYIAEQKIIEISKKYPIKFIILRPSNVFGENDKDKKLLNLFKSLKYNHFIYLDKEAKVNYVYVKLITKIIFDFIEIGKFNNQIFNINSKTTVYEFVEFIKQELNIHNKTIEISKLFHPIIFLISILSDFFPPRLQLINSNKYKELTNKKTYKTDKINKILELEESVCLYNGLHNLIEYYKTNNLL